MAKLQRYEPDLDGFLQPDDEGEFVYAEDALIEIDFLERLFKVYRDRVIDCEGVDFLDGDEYTEIGIEEAAKLLGVKR